MAAYPAMRQTVLVADPDPAQQRLLAHCLASRFQVLAAGSLSDAAQLIALHRPAIILLEPNQPDGDGLELIRYLRGLPEASQLIIACVTIRTSMQAKVAGFQAGANDYITKPINPATFPSRVGLMLRLHHIEINRQQD